MAEIIRAALVQTDWPGSKDAMIEKHEAAAREAAAQGAKVICFQELFYGPYSVSYTHLTLPTNREV